MTNQEILYKAIRKAIKNGWKIDKDILIYDIPKESNYFVNWRLISSIVFSHEFAKTFWGKNKHTNNEICKKCGCVLIPCETMPYMPDNCWQYHLQQMVLELDPLKYLEKFL